MLFQRPYTSKHFVTDFIILRHSEKILATPLIILVLYYVVYGSSVDMSVKQATQGPQTECEKVETSLRNFITEFVKTTVDFHSFVKSFCKEFISFICEIISVAYTLLICIEM